MAYSLTWLPEVLRKAGLRVVEQPGWQPRGHGDVGKIQFVLCHHTAEKIDANMQPELRVLTEGRPGLTGPLAQLGLGQDGTYYVIAAGLAYHAGAGSWKGIVSGNAHSIGIEAENNGLGEPWPDAQMDAYARGCAAILTHIGAGVDMCVGHKEWAPQRKIDPSFDMVAFRQRVLAFMPRRGRVFVPRMISLLKRWELFMPKAYKDKDGSWHVGYGHGNAAKVPPFVDETTVLKNETEAMSILMDDLQYLVPIVEKQIKVPINDNQFCALLDVAYNRGPGTLRESAVMFHVNNTSDPLHLKRAAHAFVFHEPRADGTDFAKLDTAFDPVFGEFRVYLGLTLRRIDDAALFQSPMGD